VTPSSSLITEQDLYLFNEGTHYRLDDHLGAHPVLDGEAGTWFAVWAPNAVRVSVMGDWNDWAKGADLLALRGSSGIWEGFVPGAGKGSRYKYHIESRFNGYRVDKADPFAFYAETPPRQASVVWDLGYTWGDGAWMAARGARQTAAAPISTYEVHLGSWRRVPEEGLRSLTYREAAPLLAEHVKTLGFTHVELMPIMEHPFYGSWGYQSTGYFAPTSRHGTPQDFMYLVDHLHQQGIGVILDWVPSHFPVDVHGLAFFDGTHLYEHADPRQGFHPDWGSYIFNYGRPEVRSFLISSGLFWLEKYHADGLRVDAVASMLYLDYSRRAGEWIPNKFGGRENLEAIHFLRTLNEEVCATFPDIQMIAEESTAWPMVSRPTYVGGLGFGFKWDMGWMHDTLKYLEQDPIHRKFHHNKMTFRTVYAFSENFVLPLSHDEVVHGKGSLVNKMPGDVWQKLANLRLLYGALYTQPGKKLLFMGAELAQWKEWNHDASLDWNLLEDPQHAGICRWLEDLNRFYRAEPALHELDCSPDGFEWIDANDADHSVFSYLRKGTAKEEAVLAVFNFTPVVRGNYRLGVPAAGFWQEILNSDAARYGGTNHGNLGGVDAVPIPLHSRPYSLTLTLPPLGMLLLKRVAPSEGATDPIPEPPAETPDEDPDEDPNAAEDDPDETQFVL
jgi:1,4-alpha-glucan branching enzyme